MRHGNKINHLGRKYGHRSALLSNLATSLILNKRIITTVAKAKELRMFVEPIITKSKDNSTNNRRVAFSYLKNKFAAKELFDVVGPAVVDRPGGYLRIIKSGFRSGDNADMAYIELVDFNDVYVNTKPAEAKKKTRRSGSRKSATKVEEVTEESSAEVVDTNETPTEE